MLVSEFILGLFLFVSIGNNHLMPDLTDPALFAILVVLCCIRDCDFWTDRLFLACDPFVSLHFTDTLSYYLIFSGRTGSH